MKPKEKGFTLVELLAVIVILSIILAIAIPSITGIVANQRKAAFGSHIKMIIKGAELKMLEAQGQGDNAYEVSKDHLADYGGDITQFAENGFEISDEGGTIKVSAKAAPDGKFAGSCVVNATYNDIEVIGSEEDGCDLTKHGQED